VTELAVTVAVNSTKKGDGVSSGALSEGEERTVSVLIFQWPKIADAIAVTNLKGNGEESGEEVHGEFCCCFGLERDQFSVFSSTREGMGEDIWQKVINEGNKNAILNSEKKMKIRIDVMLIDS
jgi:hypothetical protein